MTVLLATELFCFVFDTLYFHHLDTQIYLLRSCKVCGKIPAVPQPSLRSMCFTCENQIFALILYLSRTWYTNGHVNKLEYGTENTGV